MSFSDADVAVRVRGLSKSYSISHETDRPTNLAEAVTRRLRNPLRRGSRETFWALRDVDFDVGRGEVVGIIGRNGAGKSTLLKILSRITEPTDGRVELFGRVGSLLEVGTGFHPELTGRENIYLNGAILGMRREEIRGQFDAIVEFAGVERFLDTPVKRYSSGMYVRLAFAVAAHLNPEILVVDEVLAVGDAGFQAKCLGKMRDVASAGRTVLFVSHQMAALRRLCDRCLLFNDGQLVLSAGTDAAIHHYINGSQSVSEDEQSLLPVESIKDGVRLDKVDVWQECADAGVDLYMQLSLHVTGKVERLGIGVHVTTEDGTLLAKLPPDITGAVLRRPIGTFRCVLMIPKINHRLAAGRYRLGVDIREYLWSHILEANFVKTFDIPEYDVLGNGQAMRLSEHSAVPMPVRIVSGPNSIQGDLLGHGNTVCHIYDSC